MSTSTLIIRRPDDWHVHLRDEALLGAVLDATASVFARAVVMPNLRPPITTTSAAAAYRARIQAALAPGTRFTPLLACYLTEAIDLTDFHAGVRDGVFSAVKYYPAGATTNSDAGVAEFKRVYPLLEAIQTLGIPLLVHGEVADIRVDIFDREAVFIDRVLAPLRRDFPALKLVLEHVTTIEGVGFVTDASGPTAATITPHHLMLNRNAMFERGLRPHAYCLPVVKRERHRLALRAAATSGDPRFFLGTDSAPHLRHLKEHECGCAGIFNAPTALACYAQVFDEEQKLDKLEGFAALHGAAFYGLAANTEVIELSKSSASHTASDLAIGPDAIRVFTPPGGLRWHVSKLPHSP